MLMEITEYLAFQQSAAINSITFSLPNITFEKHETLDLKTQEMLVELESKSCSGKVIATTIITLVLSLTIYGTVSMYCYDPTCPVPCIDERF